MHSVMETILNDCLGADNVTPKVLTLGALLDSRGQVEFYGWVWGLSLSLELYAYGKKLSKL